MLPAMNIRADLSVVGRPAFRRTIDRGDSLGDVSSIDENTSAPSPGSSNRLYDST
jgi:hypothetical protein